MPLWLIHLVAAATALALAEHWIRYALVERKRARRVAARLERIRRGRERREDARFRDLIAFGRSPEGQANYAANARQEQLAAAGLASYAEQMRALQGVGACGGLGSAAQLMAMGLNPAAQTGQDAPWMHNTGTMQYDPTVIDPQFGTRVGWVPVEYPRRKPRGPLG